MLTGRFVKFTATGGRKSPRADLLSPACLQGFCPLQIEVLSGIASFERIRHRHHDDAVFLYAFDLIELDGDNLWRNPLEVRKATLANVIAPAAPGIRLNEHIEEDGPIVFQHASSAWKASSPSARIPATDPDVRHILSLIHI